MKIFGFFKKEKQFKEIEMISEDKLSEWLSKKKDQHRKNEQEFLAPIKERISQFVSELKLEISALESVDIEKKKVDSRIKLIVRKNLRNYIEYLQKMIEKLSEINKREKIIEKINFVFDDFNKKSKISYEKVTFLIGKEMQVTKESVKKFLRDLERILKDNSTVFKEFEIIGLLESDIERLKRIKEDKSKLLKILDEDTEKIKELERNIKNKKREIEELKKSDRFKQEENKRKELELKTQKLERDIYSLNGLINFKALSNFYHQFENERKLVKDYRENFKQTLHYSKTNKLMDLLKESKLDNPKISEIIEKINDKEKEILETFIDDIGVGSLEKEMDRIKSEIQTIESEKLIKEKRLKNVEEDLKRVFDKIKSELEKIDVGFEG